jgi:GTP-binding protein
LREWLQHQGVMIVVVATKADKISPNKRAVHIQTVRRTLAMPADEPLQLFSAHTHEGRLQLWQRLTALLTPVAHGRGMPAM